MTNCKTVLVVDDDQVLREAVCEYIQHIRPQWRTVEAVNGQKGIELAESVKPDLILTDLRMPVMDGYKMIIALQTKSETCAIPLILNTSEDDSCPQVRQLRLVCNEVIYKPFLFSELHHVLERALPASAGTEYPLPHHLNIRQIRLWRLGNHLPANSRYTMTSAVVSHPGCLSH